MENKDAGSNSDLIYIFVYTFSCLGHIKWARTASGAPSKQKVQNNLEWNDEIKLNQSKHSEDSAAILPWPVWAPWKRHCSEPVLISSSVACLHTVSQCAVPMVNNISYQTSQFHFLFLAACQPPYHIRSGFVKGLVLLWKKCITSFFDFFAWSEPFRERAPVRYDQNFCSTLYKKEISFPTAQQLHPINISTVKIQTLQMLPHGHENPKPSIFTQTLEFCMSKTVENQKKLQENTCTLSLHQCTSIKATDASLPQSTSNRATFFPASARQTSLEVKQHSTSVLLPLCFIFKTKVSQSDRPLKQTLYGSVTHLFPWPQLNVVRADAARLNAAIRPLELQQYSLFQMSEQNGPTPHV